jgi:hypothetical protein
VSNTKHHVWCQPLLCNVSSRSDNTDPTNLSQLRDSLVPRRKRRVAFSGAAGSTTDLISSLQGCFAEDLLCSARANRDQSGHLRRLAHRVSHNRSSQFLGGGAATASCRPPPLPEVCCGEIPDLRLLRHSDRAGPIFFLGSPGARADSGHRKIRRLFAHRHGFTPPSPVNGRSIYALLSILRDGRTQPSTPGLEHCAC